MCNSVCQPLNLLSAPLNSAKLLHILVSNFSTSGLIYQCDKGNTVHKSVIPVTAWGCSVTVVVGVGDGILLVGSGVATLVGVWPCVNVLVGTVDEGLLVGSGVAALVGVWAGVTVLVGIVDRGLLVGGGIAMLLEAWPCVTVLVSVVDDVPLVVGGVAASVGGGLPVGSTVLMLLVVLGPVEVSNIHFKKFV